MSVHRIQISIEDLAKDLGERIAELPVVIKRGMQSGTMFGRSLLTKKSPTDQGQLRNSWKLVDFPGGARGRATMTQLVNEAPHAGIVERGARPHRVSQEGIEALTQWVWRNRRRFNLGRVQGPVAPSRIAKGGRKAMQRRSDLEQAKGIAFAIAWKIRHHGQKPTYFVRSSMPKISSVTRAEVVREIDRLAGTRFR